MDVSFPIVELGSLLMPDPQGDSPQTRITQEDQAHKGTCDETAKEAKNTHEVLISSLESYGLCYIRLDAFEKGYAAKIGKSALSAAKEFFALPQGVKDSIACNRSKPGVTRGYLNVGSESGGEYFERKEAFSYSFDWKKTGMQPSNPLEAENVWPSSGASEIRRKLEDYYEKAGMIIRAVAKALVPVIPRCPQDALPQTIQAGNSISLMRCFYYHARQKTERKECGSVQHTDWGFATLIAQEAGSEPALQALCNGKWVDVPPVHNTLLLNIGDYAALLSEGRLHSPLHRVILTAQDRYSMVYFQYPEFNAKLPPSAFQNKVDISLFKNQRESGAESQNAPTETSHDACFGEFIVRKWEQVKRAGRATPSLTPRNNLR